MVQHKKPEHYNKTPEQVAEKHEDDEKRLKINKLLEIMN